jgi:aminoglycoside phosphotransferase (APT) family kinase protein
MAFLSARLGTAVTVSALRRLPGGASRETWAFDAEYEASGLPIHQALVLRRDPPGAWVQGRRTDEFHLLRAAAGSGVPVPQVHWMAEDRETLGAPFFVMDRIEGETIARRLLRDPEYSTARAQMTGQLGRILAAIHRIDCRANDLSFLPAPAPDASPAGDELQRYEQIYRAITPDPHPAFELALRWLRSRLPEGSPRAVVHGDFRIGNVIFGPEGTRAILDWELAHIGDPMEDLGWICVRSWRFGGSKPVGGIGTREELFAAYEAAGGCAVDPARVRFWELLGNLKWGIMTIMQAKSHLDGQVRSVELASIGRRTAEVELELLDLMEEGS